MNSLEFPPKPEVKKDNPSELPIESLSEEDVLSEDERAEKTEELPSEPETTAETQSEDDDSDSEEEEAAKNMAGDKKEQAEINPDDFQRKTREKALAESQEYFERTRGDFSDLIADEEKMAMGNKFEELLTVARAGGKVDMDIVLEKFGPQFEAKINSDEHEVYGKLIAEVVNGSGPEYLLANFYDGLDVKLDPEIRFKKAEKKYETKQGYYFDDPRGQERLKEIESIVEKELKKAAEGQQ